MIAGIGRGYVEHGHLYGQPATIVALDSGATPAFSSKDIPSRGLVYLFCKSTGPLGQREADFACSVARRIRSQTVSVAACVRPGVEISDNRLCEASVLRVTADDVRRVFPGVPPERIGSISVHGWHGSGVMRSLQQNTPYHGRHLILSADEIGHAKAWLHEEDAMRWRIVPQHPLNELEPAELEAQFAR
jgi:hypothetical protein